MSADGIKPLKYFTIGRDVYLSGAQPRGQHAKLICRAMSNRLAQKIASNMNAMESRKQRAHEIFAHGTGNPTTGPRDSRLGG